MFKNIFLRIFPFFGWFKEINPTTVRLDFVAGLTVALVLIPQSMAYAQLAGLPAYYGLYAAFLPPMIAALFGSSRQLATGPVAVVSLMTSAALEPLATAGSEAYVGYALLLALTVGAFQLGLGMLRLGIVVNFLSHPVVGGFTNAAALIIATSQLSKLFGVYVDSAEHHYETVWRVIVAAVHFTHWPSLGLGILAFGIMVGLKRVNPRFPFVLAAVVTTSLIAWAVGFEHNVKLPASRIRSPETVATMNEFNRIVADLTQAGEERSRIASQLYDLRDELGEKAPRVLQLSLKRDLLEVRIQNLKEHNHRLREQLRSLVFAGVSEGGTLTLVPSGTAPPGASTDGRRWRLKVGSRALPMDEVLVMGGGAVVGEVPRGLPSVVLPHLDLKVILQLLPVAVIISLLGFMEAISIAKAMAAKTRQRLDPNQELIGQGLANILGSLAQSYAVSGSFSRSAVNLGAGAVTGLSSVFTSLVVLLTLLFFTPLLYNIPQSVLAAVIMMAVVGLINVKGFVHAYHAQKYDGIIAVVSFLTTLAFAPHLDKGILVGVVLSLGHFLYRGTRPSLTRLSRHPDQSFRDAERHGLRECQHIAVIRVEGPLFFANSNYLEDQILDRVEAMPQLRHILVAGNGINEVDASGEETLSQVLDRLREQGIGLSFSGLNEKVLDLFRRTHLLEKIGEENIYPTQVKAIESIHPPVHEHTTEEACPLLNVVFWDPDKLPEGKLVVQDVELLLVDDEEEFVAYLQKRLKRKGLAVTAATSGKEALRILEHQSFEVILMDIKMPELSGEDLLKEVRLRHPRSRVIMLTGFGTNEQAFRMARMGAFDFLAKPCPMDKLVKVINRAVVDARSASEAKGAPADDEQP